jgi:two-component system heavy metal sensor histidine kinase CusS
LKFNGRISITRRLTLLFVFASSTVLLTLGLVIASSLQGHFEQQDIAILTKQMELVRTGLHELTSFDDFRHFAHLPAVTAGD